MTSHDDVVAPPSDYSAHQQQELRHDDVTLPMYAEKVVAELIDTERTYVAELQQIVQVPYYISQPTCIVVVNCNYYMCACLSYLLLSPVSIQTQSLALRALRKLKPQETQALKISRKKFLASQ